MFVARISLKKLQAIYEILPDYLDNHRWTLFATESNTLYLLVPGDIHDVKELNAKYGFSLTELRRIDLDKSGGIQAFLDSLSESRKPDEAIEVAIKDFQKMIDRDNPKRPTRFVLAGHGFADEAIANIPVKSFGKLLKIFADTGAEFLYILSCEVAGTNLVEMQQQINKIIGDTLKENLKATSEKLPLLKPGTFSCTIVVQATSDVKTLGIPNFSVMFTMLDEFYKQTSSEGLKQMRQGQKRLTMIDILKAALGRDATSLASIRFPGTTVFFRAADLGEMEIITWLRLQKMRMEAPLGIVLLKKQQKQALKRSVSEVELQQQLHAMQETSEKNVQEGITIEIKPEIKYVQMFPCNLLDFSFELQDKQEPKFISKIPGPAQHFIGRITYTSSAATPERSIQEFIDV